MSLRTAFKLLLKANKVVRGPVFEGEFWCHRGIPLGPPVTFSPRKHSLDLLQDATAALSALLAALYVGAELIAELATQKRQGAE
jgi:hypothetical protein